MLHDIEVVFIWISAIIAVLLVGPKLLRYGRHQLENPRNYLSEEEIKEYRDKLFNEICRCIPSVGDIVTIGSYLCGHKCPWKLRRVLIQLIIHEGWIEKVYIEEEGYEAQDGYALTDAGWLERKARRMGDSGPKINQDLRGATVTHAGNWNIESQGSVSRGDVNIGRDQAFASLAKALQRDALSASTPQERETARVYARQIDEALAREDRHQASTVVERIKGFLDLATAGFALTHDIMRQFFT